MTNVGIAKRIEKDQPKADMKAADLKVFNPDEFETHKDAFQNLLSQTTSVTRKCSLLYIVRPALATVVFTYEFEERMFQMSWTGQEYHLYHRPPYAKLRAFLIGSAVYAWIKQYNHAANERRDFQAWVDYYNEEEKLNKRTALEKARMRDLHCKNEQSMSFKNTLK